MKKILLAALCVAMAAPAFARDHTLNGFFQVRGIVNNYGLGAAPDFTKSGDREETSKIIEQRVRMKYTMGLNEYLSFTYYGEIDFNWGDEAFSNDGRNDGGAIQGDTTNLETKNLYMSVKIPETPVSGVLGLQGFRDNWSGYFLVSDVAGITLTASNLADMVDIRLGTYKLWEGTAVSEDDVDLYALRVGLKPMGGLKLGADLFYANDNDFDTSTAGTSAIGVQNEFAGADLYWLGANASYMINPADFAIGLDGWAMYNWGTLKGDDDDVDVAGWAADLMASFSVAGVKASLEGFYVSGDDDQEDNDIEQPLSTALWSGSPAVYGAAGPDLPFYKSGLMILLYDPRSANFSSAALRHAQDGSLGLWGLVLQGSFTPPAMKQIYVQGAIGYINGVEDAAEAYNTDGDTNLGTEVALRIGYKMADALDLSLNGAYAFLGDFYDNWATDENQNSDDPEDPYLLYAAARLTF